MVSTRIRRLAELACEASIRFLCAARVAGVPGLPERHSVADSQGTGIGSWHDFSLGAGPSDEWVTAYTASALAEVNTPLAREAAASAWALLNSRAFTRGSGFGYNGRTSCDADSSAWACRLAQSLGESGPSVSTALAFITTCQRDDGGIGTYPSEDAVRRTICVPPEMRVDGWIRSHSCVTAAAALLRGIDNGPLRRYLRCAQSPEGAWSGYWWADPEYATALAVEALSMNPEREDLQAIALARKWAESSRTISSPFVLALRLLVGVHTGLSAFDGDLESLLDLQFADGSWGSSARLRQPAPFVSDPDKCWYWDYSHEGFMCIRRDQCRVFTTATAVRALNAWLLKN